MQREPLLGLITQRIVGLVSKCGSWSQNLNATAAQEALTVGMDGAGSQTPASGSKLSMEGKALKGSDFPQPPTTQKRPAATAAAQFSREVGKSLRLLSQVPCAGSKISSAP